MESVATINQESIPGLTFYQDEVCEKKENKVRRLKNLKKATILGNGLRRQAKIVFKCSKGNVHQVKTIIRAVGDHFVALGEGITIPITSILSVDVVR